MGRFESRFVSGLEIQRRGTGCAASGAPDGPRLQPQPTVRAGLERRHRSDVHCRRVVLQIVIQKRPQHVLAEPERGVTAEAQIAPRELPSSNLPGRDTRAPSPGKPCCCSCPSARWPCRQPGSVDVFLIPEPVHEHDRHVQRLPCQNFVHGLIAPEGIVARMLDQLAPEADLIHTMTPPQLPGRARLHEHVVVVVMTGPPL